MGRPNDRTTLTFVALLAGLACAACGGAEEEAPARTERERDSLIGQSSLPGASGVRGALGARDSASARSARLDSIARSNQR